MFHSMRRMNPFSPFGMPAFDPSKMDPKLLMQLSQIVQQLPPDQLSRMQTLMHNAMAGFDIRKDMEEFERTLPPGFREKIMALMVSQGGQANGNASQESHEAPTLGSGVGTDAVQLDSASVDLSVRQARLTVLEAVACGQMTPEEAEKLLFA